MNSIHADKIKTSLKIYATYQLIIATVAAIFSIAIVKSNPPTPPSLKEKEFREQKYNRKNKEVLETMINGKTTNSEQAQNIQTQTNLKTFIRSLFQLIQKKQFLIILLMMSITQTIEVLYQTLIDQLIIAKFPGKEQQIGIIGCIAVLLCFFTNLGVGSILDKVRAYKQVSLGIFFVSGIGAVAWIALLSASNSLTAIAVALCYFDEYE